MDHMNQISSMHQSSPSLESTSSTTLFVADMPKLLQGPQFTSLFSNYPGFKSARLRRDKNANVVGFVEFSDTLLASKAKDTLQGYSGMNIHFSHNHLSGIRKPRNEEEGSVSWENGKNPALVMSEVPPLYTNHTHPTLQTNLNLFPLPTDASSTLYVEGLPLDATEREVAHIFRPFPGYSSLRILAKQSKHPARTYNLLFVEFDNKYQATFAMHHLQGYRMDKNDSKGLHISYAKKGRKETRRNGDPTQFISTNDEFSEEYQ